MMNLEQCYSTFKELKELSIYINSGYEEVGLPIYEKIYWALSHKILPSDALDNGGDGRAYPCYRRCDGLIYEADTDESDISATGEYIRKGRLIGSDLLITLFHYYNKSPYWYVFTRDATIEPGELCELDEKEKADAVLVTRELFYDAKVGECVYEDECLDKFRELAYAPANYFIESEEVGCDISDDCMVLKSYLLPHYFKLDKKAVMAEHEPYKQMVEEGIQTLKETFCGIFVLEPNLKASYFTFFDGSSESQYAYPVSVGSISKAVMLAGMLIDMAILKLDEYYNILPDSLKQGGGGNE